MSISECDALRDPNPLTVFLSVFILVGIIVSYLPQHAKIILQRSSNGLSPWWVLLGSLSSIGALGNILTLRKTRADISCCAHITGPECTAALLGVAQIGLQWSCFMLIVMLFLIYSSPLPRSNSSAISLSDSTLPKKRDSFVVGVVTLLSLLFVGLGSIVLVARYPHQTQIWADALGTVAGVVAMVQYLPQILFTWTAGELGSLSVATMLIQVPGAFLFAFSLGLRVGWDGWSTWIVYVVTGLLQSVVLALAIAYWVRDCRQAALDSTIEESDDPPHPPADGQRAHERTSLLRSHSGSNNRLPQRTQDSDRQFSMLYAATPPDYDSDRS